ncbi:viral membrane formation (Cop-A11R) [Mythimna separata entomopoxvirus 'L']|uniref:Viral membrane formation (Cop-A11R) n=1 Tax=Mythimna separata entomopoxvirus 'L' TaxID=1293572 RepID=A0A916NYH6_9POXV|nr:viral membrane formation (Cop-A11R) [Mythimna separata entomopoxvirus 'L']CCU56378.1 viral membrane formation (Cop-A11R) [Mythimna separata entomopoxvirus 'L']
MTVSKLIEFNNNDVDIFDNENYPGKIAKHMFPTKIENFKIMYKYLNNEENNIIEEEYDEDYISNCSSVDKNISTLYENNYYEPEKIKSDINDLYNDNNDKNYISNQSSYFEEDDISDVNIINNYNNNIDNTNIKKNDSNLYNNIKDLSKTEIIKQQNEEISELKKIAKTAKMSANLDKFMERLKMPVNNIYSKKIMIINYAKSINLPLLLEDLENLDYKDIEDMYNIIENVKSNKNSYNFTNLLIKFIFVGIEKILVDILKWDVFKEISNNIDDDFIELQCKTTKNFINSYVVIPSYPFMDILIQIFNRIVYKYISIPVLV